jgi:hypothetical protein
VSTWWLELTVVSSSTRVRIAGTTELNTVARINSLIERSIFFYLTVQTMKGQRIFNEGKNPTRKAHKPLSRYRDLLRGLVALKGLFYSLWFATNTEDGIRILDRACSLNPKTCGDRKSKNKKKMARVCLPASHDLCSRFLYLFIYL